MEGTNHIDLEETVSFYMKIIQINKKNPQGTDIENKNSIINERSRQDKKECKHFTKQNCKRSTEMEARR